ncbi:glycoside hydrolase family 97 C-terminal domain-containing protein [Prevotella sp. Sow4_E9_plate]|uniref:glycoside hydrolase family 97 C-terminal domain-containing protein n=1 Tax=Prevotella sp. Sow4_E9_plate TaxID=3438802 RepID=UPI003F9C9B4A
MGEDFLQKVPTTWDNIKFLGGTPDTYIALAKKTGEQWYVGIINNSQQRTINLDLSFLPKGNYRLEFWKDGKKANSVATDCEHKIIKISSAKALNVKLANAGGYVCVISK